MKDQPRPGEEVALPLVVEAASADTDLAAHLRRGRDELAAALDRHGAVCFRGFAVGGVAGFATACETVAAPLMEYRDRATPRTVVAGRVLTATDYPPNVAITLHNEHVFAAEFPWRLFFHCLRPAAEGGETPLADVRRVYACLPVGIRDEIARRGLRYVRRLGARFGLDWRDAFQTEDRATVERYCREAGITWEWVGDTVRTCQRRPAVAVHPRTGERVWLNHAVTLHTASLEPAKRRMLRKLFGPDELPNDVTYGDGAPIADEVITVVRQAYDDAAVLLPWQAGDVLVVDNLLVAHGRRPFRGARELVVAMAAPVRWADVAAPPPEGGPARPGADA